MKSSKTVIASTIASMLYAPVVALASDAQSQSELVRIRAEEILDSRSGVREEILRGLADPKIVGELESRGVTPLEVKERLAGMTDRELLQIQTGVERQVGGDRVIISTTALILIVLIIVLIAA